MSITIDKAAIQKFIKDKVKKDLIPIVKKALSQDKKSPASKLIFPKEVKQHLDEILAPLLDPAKWKSLGLKFAPNPHAVVLLTGAPGTGKTAIANFLARQFRRKPVEINFAGVASPMLGKTEENIKEIFTKATEEKSPVLILEECDALLWDRNRICEDTMHILGFVNTLLTEIDKFKEQPFPTLLIFTTNFPKLLDAAMQRRITDTIELFPPTGEAAEKMWASKLPISINETMMDEHWKQLCNLGATPDQMEKAILRVCRKALLEKRQPTFADFQL